MANHEVFVAYGWVLPSASQSTSLKLGPLLVLTPNTASLYPTKEIKMKMPEEDKEIARVDCDG